MFHPFSQSFEALLFPRFRDWQWSWEDCETVCQGTVEERDCQADPKGTAAILITVVIITPSSADPHRVGPGCNSVAEHTLRMLKALGFILRTKQTRKHRVPSGSDRPLSKALRIKTHHHPGEAGLVTLPVLKVLKDRGLSKLYSMPGSLTTSLPLLRALQEPRSLISS